MAVSWHMIIIIAIKTVRLRVWGWTGREERREWEREMKRRWCNQTQHGRGGGKEWLMPTWLKWLPLRDCQVPASPFMDAKRKREKWFLSPHQPAYDANWLSFPLSFSFAWFFVLFPLIYCPCLFLLALFSSIDENNWCTWLLSISFSLTYSSPPPLSGCSLWPFFSFPLWVKLKNFVNYN